MSHQIRVTSIGFSSVRPSIGRLAYLLMSAGILYGPALSSPPTIIRPIARDSTYGQVLADPQKAVRRPLLGLVLSGGGARGISQIGVLRAFERHHIPVDFIAATSLGAVVGGLYAAGYSTAEIESIAINTDWDHVLSLGDDAERGDLFVDEKQAADKGVLTIRLDGWEPVLPPAVSSGQRLTNLLNTLTLQALYHPNPEFDDLRIPFRAISTDLVTGERVVHDRGSLAEALRASATVPLLFSPVEQNGRKLVDGGLLSNIPVDVVENLGCDLAVVVNSTSGLRDADGLSAPWQTADQIMGIMMQLPNSLQLRNADVVITPRIGDHLSSDFTGLDSLILLGEAAAEHMIDSIRVALHQLDTWEAEDATSWAAKTILMDLSDATLPDSIRARLAQSYREGLTPGRLRHALSDIYAMGGYRDVYAEVLDQDSSVRIDVRLTPHPILRRIEVRGSREFSGKSPEDVCRSLIGAPLNYHHLRRCLDGILRVYRQEGLSLARLEDISFDEAEGLLSFEVNEGRIQEIQVVGAKKTDPSVVLREFPLVAGEVFDIHKANRGITDISSTLLFEYVYTGITYTEEGPVVGIRVGERPSQVVQLGLHVDNERNVQALVDLRDKNLGGTGWELGLTIDGGSRNQRAGLNLRTNRIFDSYLSSKLKGEYSRIERYLYEGAATGDPGTLERERVGEYAETRYGGEVGIGSQLERLGNATVDFVVNEVRVDDLENASQLKESYFLTLLRIGTTIDSKDVTPFPRKGIGMTFSYEVSSKSLGSEIGYNALRFSWETYATLGRRHTLHPRMTLGFGDKTMPLPEQFSLGGLGSFFGLREDDSRGRQVFLVNFEYRYFLPFRVMFDTYLSARYDFGSISQEPEEIKFASFRHGFGIQMGIDTPFGLVAIAVGRSFVFSGDAGNSVQMGPTLFYFTVGYEP